MDSVSVKQISFQKLSTLLDDMLKHYRILLDLVRKEKELLLKPEIEALNENNLAKEQMLLKLKALDHNRVVFATDLARIIHADTDQVRLLDLAQKIGGIEGDRLRNMHSALEIVVKRVSELNHENAKFAEQALKTVSSAIDSFKDQILGQKTYQNKGQYKKQVDSSGFLVQKEA